MEPDDPSEPRDDIAKVADSLMTTVVKISPKVMEAAMEQFRDAFDEIIFMDQDLRFEFYRKDGEQWATKLPVKGANTRTYVLREGGRWAHGHPGKSCYVGEGSRVETELKKQFEAYLLKMTVNE